MRKSQYYIRVLTLIIGLLLLGYYVFSVMSNGILRIVVVLLTLILIFLTLYIEINKQTLYLSSSALLEEMNIEKYKINIIKVEKYDFLNLMKSGRVMLSAFHYMIIEDYDKAYNLLLGQQDIFTEKNIKQYTEFSYIVAILMFQKKEFKQFDNVFNRIQKNLEAAEGSIVNIIFLEALKESRSYRKNDICRLFNKALENERTNFMKIVIERERIKNDC